MDDWESRNPLAEECLDDQVELRESQSAESKRWKGDRDLPRFDGAISKLFGLLSANCWRWVQGDARPCSQTIRLHRCSKFPTRMGRK